MTQGGPLLIFSAPEPKAHVHYCDHALSVIFVRHLSVRPSSLTFQIFDFEISSETAKRNSTKLDRKQDLNILYQVCVFRADRKNKMAVLASDWLRHFRLLHWNRLTEFNETWQEARCQHPLQSCVFRANRKNKMAALASDWLRHFWLLLWNRGTEFNETLQEERSQRPLPSLCFLGRSEKQDGCPGQSVKKVAHCTQVHDMWPFGPLVWSFGQRSTSNMDFELCKFFAL